MRRLLPGTPVRRPARRHLYFQRCWGRATPVQPARSKPGVHPKPNLPVPIPLPSHERMSGIWSSCRVLGAREQPRSVMPLGSGDAERLVKQLPHVYQTLNSSSAPLDRAWWFRPETPAFRRWSSENRGFKIIFRFVGKRVRFPDVAARVLKRELESHSQAGSSANLHPLQIKVTPRRHLPSLPAFSLVVNTAQELSVAFWRVEGNRNGRSSK